MNTLSTPLTFAPVLAGAVAAWISYPWAFILSIVGSAAAVVLTFSMRLRAEGKYPELGLEEVEQQ